MSKVLKIEIRRPKRGYEHYWRVMRELSTEHRTFTVGDVEARCCAPAHGDVWDYLRRLEKAGLAERTGEKRAGNGPGASRDVWRLTRTHGPAPRLRRDGSECPMDGQQKLWIAMRSLREFTAEELGYAASMDAPVPRNTVTTYLRRLAAAGYLIQTSNAYRLKPSMNTGPEAPKILATHSVWDPNRGALVGDATTEEVAS